MQHPKYGCFDDGVRNGLPGSFEMPAHRIGTMFEVLVFSRWIAGAGAADGEIRASGCRTSNGSESAACTDDRGGGATGQGPRIPLRRRCGPDRPGTNRAGAYSGTQAASQSQAGSVPQT